METAQHVITIQLHETGMISRAVQLAVRAMGLLCEWETRGVRGTAFHHGCCHEVMSLRGNQLQRP